MTYLSNSQKRKLLLLNNKGILLAACSQTFKKNSTLFTIFIQKHFATFFLCYFLFGCEKTKKQRVKKVFLFISCCVNSTHGGTQIMWYTPFTYRYHIFLFRPNNNCTVAAIFCSYNLTCY